MITYCVPFPLITLILKDEYSKYLWSILYQKTAGWSMWYQVYHESFNVLYILVDRIRLHFIDHHHPNQMKVNLWTALEHIKTCSSKYQFILSDDLWCWFMMWSMCSLVTGSEIYKHGTFLILMTLLRTTEWFFFNDQISPLINK